MRFRCPHCNAFGHVRTSEVMTEVVTWLYVACTDLECGHTWRVDAEAAVTISPSAKPNPRVHMKLSPHVRRGVLAQQLSTAAVGDHRPATPATADLFDPSG